MRIKTLRAAAAHKWKRGGFCLYCDRDVHARLLCSAHYSRWWRKRANCKVCGGTGYVRSKFRGGASPFKHATRNPCFRCNVEAEIELADYLTEEAP